MANDDVTWKSRFARVRGILAKAAGGDAKAYGDLALWDMSRDKLLLAELGGMRLVAPEAQAPKSCCHEAPSGDGAPKDRRSARSGLVLGLSGERPFDGSRYPRLPWGKAPASPDDIEVIRDWIDAGCPAEGQEAVFATSDT